jgi:hypothetical protein
MSQELVERISRGEKTLAYVVRTQFQPDKTSFVTPSELSQQLGFIVYGAGGEIPRHKHLPVNRSITGTLEVLIVRKGSCDADIFDDDNVLVTSVVLNCGDIILLVAGGHGFRIREDTILLEVKQGPFVPGKDKEHF